jgi:hypothetical protein
MKKTILLFLIFANLQSWAFDTWWHAECTRKAMTANGFSGDARLATQVSNYITDFHSAGLFSSPETESLLKVTKKQEWSFEFMHFDAIYTTAHIEKNWENIYINTVNALNKYNGSSNVKKGFKLIVLFNIIGASLHIVQDFYSHSNWVNTFDSLKLNPIPTWYQKDSIERNKYKLFTGAYPDGSAKGKINHKDLNKDYSTRNLNQQAVEVAERASIEWIKKIMEATPDLPWAELKAYNIQKDIILKNFLVKLDATFLTSSSIAAGHLDGDKPARFIFTKGPDVDKEKALARVALTHTVAEYMSYIGASENVEKIPSPYWAGFNIYLITRDLALGLRHSNKVYTPSTMLNK